MAFPFPGEFGEQVDPGRFHIPKMTRSRPNTDVSACLLNPEQYPGPEPLCWAAVFGTGHPVELEVGSGKGLFLASAASQNPAHNFLGIELSRKYARLAAERIVRRGIGNVRVWHGDARAVLARRVSDASVRAVHIYFPDPWWKKRHMKRRVFSEALLASVVRVLEPSGELRVATDVEEYFDVISTLVAAESRLVSLTVPPLRKPDHDLDYLTNFERKFRIEGRTIYRASYMMS
jgi:tRNA (guanine-N7-)-methyltransferase